MEEDKIGLVVREIEKQVEAIHADLLRYPWTERRAYAEWLAQTCFYVRRVTHVLAAAASRTTLQEGALHKHFLAGITNEGDHDKLAIADLAELGFDIAQFEEHPLTTAFYQTLFHMIETAGPTSLLGYFYVLEGLAGTRGEPVYKQVRDTYEGRGVSFLREHVMLDQEHFPASLRLLEQLGASQLDAVATSLRLAGPIYRYMVAAIRAEGGFEAGR